MAESRVEELLGRYRTLKGGRFLFEQHWEELARVMLPGRSGFTTVVTEGERLTDDIFDGTPMQAARGLANAIGGMLRPEEFFDLKASDDKIDGDDEAKAWLEDATERMYAAFENPRARFRQATGETDYDLAVFGTGPLYIGEARRLNQLLFQSLHLKDAVVFFDDEGNPQGLFHCRQFTVRQAAGMFGVDNLGKKGKQLNQDRKFDEKLEYVHAVVPRDEGRAEAMLARNLPYASLWIETDGERTGTEVSVGGFHEFPFVVPRWDTNSGEDYGRSPGMIALPDSNTLQAQGETMLVAGQRAADPPLFAPNDGTFTEANTYPGGISYYDAELATAMRGNPIFPLLPGTNMPLTREMQLDTRQQIVNAFFKNILNLPVEGPQMTATEIIERKQEFIREVGPVFGRLETDYTGPMVERAFAIMLRGNGFLPIPPVLQGRNIRFEYESPIKKIRQQIEAAAAQMLIAEALQISTVKPDVLDNINFDGYVRFRAESSGVPLNRVINDAKQSKAIRQARMKVQQEAAAMAQAEQAAGIVGQVANVPGVKEALQGAAGGKRAA
jgi:hypothetical protein